MVFDLCILASLTSKKGGLIHKIESSQQALSDVQVLIADVLDFWDPTEHPGLCSSEINNQHVSGVCNHWLDVHRVLIFVGNSIISILSINSIISVFQRGLLQVVNLISFIKTLLPSSFLGWNEMGRVEFDCYPL